MAVRHGALRAVLAGATALALLAGCAVRPSPLTEQDTERRVAEDRRTLAANRPALDGPLTLHQSCWLCRRRENPPNKAGRRGPCCINHRTSAEYPYP